MKKIIFQIIIGFLISILGFYFGVTYLLNIEKLSSLWRLGLAIIFIGIGANFLIRASKEDGAIIGQVNLDKINDVKPKLENILQKNNEILNKWAKTQEKKDKLKMLEIAANAEAQK
jgi:hypothetical protein